MRSLLLFFVALFIAQYSEAKVWRINNNLGVQADFKNTSTALASNLVQAGDTLYIESSSSSYASITLNRKLVIIGTGYFLTDATNTKTQWNTNPAVIDDITFGPGSKGSKVSGITSNFYLNDSLITVERCYSTSYLYFGFANGTYADHDTVRQCALYGIQSTNNTSFARGLMIYNNLLYGVSSFSSNLNNTTAYIINNVIGQFEFASSNCVFQNNIFLATTFGSYGNSNYFANNIFTYSSGNTGVSTSNNNQFSVSQNGIFVASSPNFNYPPTGFSHDGQFQIIAGSPAENAGSLNGTTVDCGAFGGPAPYILSGMPDIPSIYSLTVPAQVNDGTPSINISLSAASH